MKNYKKIYKRLVNEIKKETARCTDIEVTDDESNVALLRRIENRECFATLNWVLSLLPEIEGKECQMITMNENEFKEWKRKITK